MLITVTCAGCTGTIGDIERACTSSDGPPDGLAPCLPEIEGATSACSGPATTGGSQLQRLTRWQIENSLEDLFGPEGIAPVLPRIGELPAESVDDAFEVSDRFVSSQLQDTMIDIGLDLGDAVVSDPDIRRNVFGDCTDESECLETYLESFATRVFRRPLTSDEKDRARQTLARATDASEGLAEVLAAHLASPHFLIRWELGERELEPSVLELTPYEVASRLSFGLADSPPDATLLALAASGDILNEDTLRSQGARLLDSPRGREKAVALVFSWLDLPRTLDMSTLPSEFLDGVDTEGLGEAAVTETARFIEFVLFEEHGGFDDLLRSHVSFAEHPALAEIYGHAPAVDGPATMPTERHGLLHRLPFLFSASPRTNLIERGVKVRRNLFCNTMPTPSLDLINRRDERPLTDEERASLDHLSLVEHETDEPVCMTCHGFINPTGGSFEDFDSISRLRDTERTFDVEGRLAQEVPIRTAGDVPIAMDETLPVSRSSDLIEYLARSEDATACFSLRVFEQSHRRLADPRDACALETALTAMVTEGAVFDGIVSFFVHNASGIRRQASEGAEHE